MADFARIKEQDIWINLDYVVRVEGDVDDAGAAQVTFADGSTFSITSGDARRLVKKLQPARKKKKKKKKEKGRTEAETGGDQPPAASA